MACVVGNLSMKNFGAPISGLIKAGAGKIWLRLVGEPVLVSFALVIFIPIIIYKGCVGRKSKNMQKSFENVWRCQNFAYLCTRNPKEAPQGRWQKRVVKKFLKKSCKKVWWIQKSFLPLQSVSLPNFSSEHRTRFFDLLVQLREKCSIYQFLFQRGFK